MSEWILFIVFGSLAIGGALGVVLLANPVHSALSLVTTLVSMAALFLVQDADFLSAVQIIVYMGAIMVLFLFVIMMLGVDKRDPDEDTLLANPLFRYGFIAGVGALVALLVASIGITWPFGPAGTDTKEAVNQAGGNVEAIAEALFTKYLLPFELTSILVVAAIVGVTILAKRSDTGLSGVGNGRSTGRQLDAKGTEQKPVLPSQAEEPAA